MTSDCFGTSVPLCLCGQPFFTRHRPPAVSQNCAFCRISHAGYAFDPAERIAAFPRFRRKWFLRIDAMQGNPAWCRAPTRTPLARTGDCEPRHIDSQHTGIQYYPPQL